MLILFPSFSQYFNSQPHEEADHWLDKEYHKENYFNSQPHEEADIIMVVLNVFLINFNSQPHEEADIILRHQYYFQYHFNSQPHEEADIDMACAYAGISISTHSLTKRLTLFNSPFLILISHFNSQPHEEADLFFLLSNFYQLLFQLTASRRG